jgi:general secretion pathway protein D
MTHNSILPLWSRWGFAILMAGMPYLSDAQEQRATPGSGIGGGNGLSSQPPKDEVFAGELKLGDYVELDASIKNEMYGTIDFPNAELKSIIQAIAKLARKNFILDRKIENRRITIISPEPVTKQEAYNAFLSALYMNDLTLVSEGKFLKVIDAKSALQSNVRTFMGDYVPNSSEVVTVLYPLKHLNADDIQRFLQDLVPRSGRISAYPNTNTLVMTDTGFNLKRIVGILKTIDIPGHDDQLESIPIRYASAKEISRLIDEILDAQSGGRSGTSRVRSSATQRKTRGGGVITKIVPDERTNSLVALANGRGIQEIKDLVRQLDSPNAAGGGNIHVYQCKNAVAEELATTINSLISGQQKSPGAAPGGANTNAPVNALPNAPRSLNAGGGGDSSGGGIRFDGNLKVTADKPTNSLVVVASASDFSALRKVLERLDIPRRQVYVEATIMEVKLDKLRDFAASLNLAKNGVGTVAGFNPSTGAPSMASLLTAPGTVTGLLAGLTDRGNRVSYFDSRLKRDVKIPGAFGLIRALVDQTQAQILHQPQILTSDNLEAEIKVTQKIPVASATTTLGSGDSATQQRTFTKEPVEISLKITPQLGDSDLIKLKVDQTIDDFSPATEGQISTTNRKVISNVVVRDGDMVVVGGLQKNTALDQRSRIPILGDLPVLGYLFGGTSARSETSVLLLFMTPRIINDYSDLMKITGEKIQDRATIGKTATNPQDRYAAKVEKFQKINAESAKRPSPRGWSFAPRDEDEFTVEPPEATEPKDDTPPAAQPDTSARVTPSATIPSPNASPSPPNTLLTPPDPTDPGDPSYEPPAPPAGDPASNIEISPPADGGEG